MPTALVLDHFEREINEVLGGVEVTEGVQRPVRIALLAGADKRCLRLVFGVTRIWINLGTL